jgi:hypothetical protein
MVSKTYFSVGLLQNIYYLYSLVLYKPIKIKSNVIYYFLFDKN